MLLSKKSTQNFIYSKYFELLINLLVIASVILFSIDTLPDLTKETRELLDQLEIVIVVIFSTEYILRIWIEKKKTDYIFSFYGIIDILAILPYYLQLTSGSSALRLFRLLRLLRLLKIKGLSRATGRFVQALVESKDELFIFSLLSLVLIYLAALGIYFFENSAQPQVFASIFDSLWWAVATLTTVGYGDIYPITVGGKIFTFFILLIGLGLVAIPAGIISAALVNSRAKK